MTYTLIGTGNMAWLIAARMLGAGHTCVGAWGRNSPELEGLCAAFSLPRLSGIQQITDGPDACILAVSDSAIAAVAGQLALRHTTLIHTGGSIPIDALAGNSGNFGVLWPVYSIRKASLPVHRSFAAVIEANTTAALEAVRAVAKAICDITYEANSEQRAGLHLAAVVSNNFVNHLLSIATDICAGEGAPISLLQPLIEQTIANMRTQHPAESQTGPARRGDEATIGRHIAALADRPDWQALYKAMSASIMNQYRPIGG